ncbi:hypothetical protein SUGI_0607660 [Cryptomeria japonica]|nr:hypothetical protein SUGI_0607660 [Cryptomeria japonica]
MTETQVESIVELQEVKVVELKGKVKPSEAKEERSNANVSRVIDGLVEVILQKKLFGEVGETIENRLAKNPVAVNPANTMLNVKKLVERWFSYPLVWKYLELWSFKVVVDPSEKLMITVFFKGREKQIVAEEIFASFKEGYETEKSLILLAFDATIHSNDEYMDEENKEKLSVAPHYVLQGIVGQKFTRNGGLMTTAYGYAVDICSHKLKIASAEEESANTQNSNRGRGSYGN